MWIVFLPLPRPACGDKWKLRKSNRIVVIDEVQNEYVVAHSEKTKRNTTILISTLVSRYTKI